MFACVSAHRHRDRQELPERPRRSALITPSAHFQRNTELLKLWPWSSPSAHNLIHIVRHPPSDNGSTLTAGTNRTWYSKCAKMRSRMGGSVDLKMQNKVMRCRKVWIAPSCAIAASCLALFLSKNQTETLSPDAWFGKHAINWAA